MSCGHCLAAPTLSRKALVTTAVPAAPRTVAGVGLAGSYDDAKRHRRAIQGHYMRFADSVRRLGSGIPAKGGGDE